LFPFLTSYFFLDIVIFDMLGPVSEMFAGNPSL